MAHVFIPIDAPLAQRLAVGWDVDLGFPLKNLILEVRGYVAEQPSGTLASSLESCIRVSTSRVLGLGARSRLRITPALAELMARYVASVVLGCMSRADGSIQGPVVDEAIVVQNARGVLWRAYKGEDGGGSTCFVGCGPELIRDPVAHISVLLDTVR